MQSRDMREQLQRVLRTPEVLFIRINGVVGGGIFLLPGQVWRSRRVLRQYSMGLPGGRRRGCLDRALVRGGQHHV
jgi:hypothetical protein